MATIMGRRIEKRGAGIEKEISAGKEVLDGLSLEVVDYIDTMDAGTKAAEVGESRA